MLPEPKPGPVTVWSRESVLVQLTESPALRVRRLGEKPLPVMSTSWVLDLGLSARVRFAVREESGSSPSAPSPAWVGTTSASASVSARHAANQKIRRFACIVADSRPNRGLLSVHYSCYRYGDDRVLQHNTRHVPQKIIRDPVHDVIAFDIDRPIDGLLFRLLNSAEFQRLRRILQLGMAHLAYPGATHSRYGHSLGVMETSRKVLCHLERIFPINEE